MFEKQLIEELEEVRKRYEEEVIRSYGNLTYPWPPPSHLDSASEKW